MKKNLAQTPKLRLTRETLRSLNDGQLPEAAGAALTPPAPSARRTPGIRRSAPWAATSGLCGHRGVGEVPR